MKTHPCKACGAAHDLVYQRYADGTLHMSYLCPTARKRFHVPRIDGLDLPIAPNKKAQQLAQKAALEAPQMKLL